jgi:putative endonuclease
MIVITALARADRSAGGAAASVTLAKQRRIVRAAQHYLMRLPQLPPCRFDVVAIDGDSLQWIRAAFDAA